MSDTHDDTDTEPVYESIMEPITPAPAPTPAKPTTDELCYLAFQRASRYPVDRKSMVTVRMPHWLREFLLLAAKQRGVSVNAMCLDVLIREFELTEYAAPAK